MTPTDYQFFLDGHIKKRGTLAQWLDHRRTEIEEPITAVLPATINPFKFLYKNCLNNNYRIVQIQQSDCPVAGYAFGLLVLLKRVLPPENHIIINLCIQPLNTTITIQQQSAVTTTKLVSVQDTENTLVSNETTVTR